MATEKRLACPYCGKRDRVLKMGTIMTVKHGRRVRFKCDNCGHTFYPPDAPQRKKSGKTETAAQRGKK